MNYKSEALGAVFAQQLVRQNSKKATWKVAPPQDKLMASEWGLDRLGDLEGDAELGKGEGDRDDGRRLDDFKAGDLDV